MYTVPKYDTNGSVFWLWFADIDKKSPHLHSAFVLRNDLSNLHTYPLDSLLIILRAVSDISTNSIDTVEISDIISIIKKNIIFAAG